MANVIVCNGGIVNGSGLAGSGSGRKRRPSYLSDDVMDDDVVAAMVLMSLSCSPKSPRLPTSIQTDYRRIVYRCTWPGCGQQCDHCHQIEKHVRTHIGRTDVNGESSDHEEEFYYTEIEMDDSGSSGSSSDSNSGSNSSHSPHSPVPQSPSASNDGSTMSGSQSPIPSPPLSFFASSSAPTWSHLEDHEYQKPYEELESISKRSVNVSNVANISNSVTNGVYKQNQKSLLSNPINIPGISFAHQYAKSAPSVALHSPRANNKYMRLNGNNKSGTTILQSPSKNSPKRGRGESRKCRKVYGMDNRDQWCTQCKWKKACSRFTD